MNKTQIDTIDKYSDKLVDLSTNYSEDLPPLITKEEATHLLTRFFGEMSANIQIGSKVKTMTGEYGTVVGHGDDSGWIVSFNGKRRWFGERDLQLFE